MRTGIITWEDRIIGILSLSVTICVMIALAFELGRSVGIDEQKARCKPEVRVHRMVYSAEEHFRAGRAIRRMEAVK